ncbi:Tn3 family transposase [Streptosporangium sp. NPDC023615]|uniref:Tn3 family transposase n=1 Tax=Streptosporangium sp. NPDC023615 TaxID=3154794 RepID=UPI0034231984
MPVSVAACLTAHSLNAGYRPIAKKGVEALERSRLSHVHQNHFRPETLSLANVPLVDKQTGLSLARAWGGAAWSARSTASASWSCWASPTGRPWLTCPASRPAPSATCATRTPPRTTTRSDQHGVRVGPDRGALPRASDTQATTVDYSRNRQLELLACR